MKFWPKKSNGKISKMGYRFSDLPSGTLSELIMFTRILVILYRKNKWLWRTTWSCLFAPFAQCAFLRLQLRPRQSSEFLAQLLLRAGGDPHIKNEDGVSVPCFHFFHSQILTVASVWILWKVKFRYIHSAGPKRLQNLWASKKLFGEDKNAKPNC